MDIPHSALDTVTSRMNIPYSCKWRVETHSKLFVAPALFIIIENDIYFPLTTETIRTLLKANIVDAIRMCRKMFPKLSLVEANDTVKALRDWAQTQAMPKDNVPRQEGATQVNAYNETHNTCLRIINNDPEYYINEIKIPQTTISFLISVGKTHKIEAIKWLRNIFGIGLAEALHTINHILTLDPTVNTNPANMKLTRVRNDLRYLHGRMQDGSITYENAEEKLREIIEDHSNFE